MKTFLVFGAVVTFALSMMSAPSAAEPMYGSLEVTGEAGDGQPDTYTIYRCRESAEHVYEWSSCEAWTRTQELNKETELPRGVYRLNYANSYYGPVKIAEGATVKVELRKLEVKPRSTQIQNYAVFVDYTHESEFTKLALAIFSTSRINSFHTTIFSWGFKLECDEFMKSPKALAAVHLSIGKDARFYERRYFSNGTRGWDDQGRVFVHKERINVGDSKGFLSVFPGFYGVSYEDREERRFDELGAAAIEIR